MERGALLQENQILGRVLVEMRFRFRCEVSLMEVIGYDLFKIL